MSDRLVIVLEQAADLGGQERVAQALLEQYPSALTVAPHFIATNRPPGHVAPWDERVQLIGHSRARRSPFLAPLYARRLSRAGTLPADVALSLAQSGWSLAAHLPPGTPRVCYSSGLPAHLYASKRQALRDQPRALRPVLAAGVPALRAFDRRLIRQVSRLIANSRFTARELEHVHHRQAEVIHPPVRTGYFRGDPTVNRRAFLMVGRLVAPKRAHLVVEAFRSLPDEQLVVVGDGPALPQLRRSAPPNVTFLGAQDDTALLHLYRSSRALICPSRESFGIVMGEAQACGIPVIAAREGGAPEVVIEGVTGILLDRPDPRSIAEGVAAMRNRVFEPRACRASAERFAQERFSEAIDRVVREEFERADGRAVRRAGTRGDTDESVGAPRPVPGQSCAPLRRH